MILSFPMFLPYSILQSLVLHLPVNTNVSFSPYYTYAYSLVNTILPVYYSTGMTIVMPA